MPCYDPRDTDKGMCEDAQKEAGQLRALLCKVCTYVETEGHSLRFIDDIPELQDWWEAHKVWDANRQKEELRQALDTVAHVVGSGHATPENLAALEKIRKAIDPNK